MKEKAGVFIDPGIEGFGIVWRSAMLGNRKIHLVSS